MSVGTKRSLTPARRWLLERMQRVCFGKMFEVQFCNGDPVSNPAPRVQWDYRFGGKNGPHPKTDLEDFAVKDKVSELFDYMDRKQNGVINVLIIQHGLPFEMKLDEEP